MMYLGWNLYVGSVHLRGDHMSLGAVGGIAVIVVVVAAAAYYLTVASGVVAYR
jgi:hypothetical protein